MRTLQPHDESRRPAPGAGPPARQISPRTSRPWCRARARSSASAGDRGRSANACRVPDGTSTGRPTSPSPGAGHLRRRRVERRPHHPRGRRTGSRPVGRRRDLDRRGAGDGSAAPARAGCRRRKRICCGSRPPSVRGELRDPPGGGDAPRGRWTGDGWTVLLAAPRPLRHPAVPRRRRRRHPPALPRPASTSTRGLDHWRWKYARQPLQPDR